MVVQEPLTMNNSTEYESMYDAAAAAADDNDDDDDDDVITNPDSAAPVWLGATDIDCMYSGAVSASGIRHRYSDRLISGKQGYPVGIHLE